MIICNRVKSVSKQTRVSSRKRNKNNQKTKEAYSQMYIHLRCNKIKNEAKITKYKRSILTNAYSLKLQQDKEWGKNDNDKKKQKINF